MFCLDFRHFGPMCGCRYESTPTPFGVCVSNVLCTIEYTRVCVRTHACLHTLRTCDKVRACVRAVCVHRKQHPRMRTLFAETMYALSAFHCVLLTTIHADNHTANARKGVLSATWRRPCNSGRTRARSQSERAYNKCIRQRSDCPKYHGSLESNFGAPSIVLASSQACSAGMAELIGVDSWRLVANTQTVSKSSHLSRH